MPEAGRLTITFKSYLKLSVKYHKLSIKLSIIYASEKLAEEALKNKLESGFNGFIIFFNFSIKVCKLTEAKNMAHSSE